METPDQILAKKIAERLKAEGLLLNEDLAKVEAKLVTGNLKAEDWQVAVQKAGDKELQE